MTEDLIKALALKQYKGDDFFILDDKAYEGTLQESKQEYANYVTDTADDEAIDTFEEWFANNCTEIEEYDESTSDYLVLTDEEADDKAFEYVRDLWDDVYVSKELKDSFLYNYIDFDQATKDAIATDGRGHSLASYDGHEHEETVKVDGQSYSYYIYRIN